MVIQGELKKRMISDNKSKAMMSKLQRITNKNNCFDVFQDVKIRDIKVYPEKPITGVVRYKVVRANKHSEYQKLKLIRGVGCFQGLTFIEILLKQISLAKEIFLLNLAQGDEIIIPEELSQKKLPLSYRFYDPIMKLIQEDLSKDMREFFSLQRKYTVERLIEEDMQRRILEEMGVSSPLDKRKENNVFKYSIVNKDEKNRECNFLDSKHPRSLQTSDYIKIENGHE